MKLPASATIDETPQLLRQLDEALAGSDALRIDASALQQFDTSTIALLMQARREAKAAGRAFSLSGMPPKLTELARLYGVEELLSASAGPAASADAA